MAAHLKSDRSLAIRARIVLSALVTRYRRRSVKTVLATGQSLAEKKIFAPTAKF
jgi:hypothetical protein